MDASPPGRAGARLAQSAPHRVLRHLVQQHRRRHDVVASPRAGRVAGIGLDEADGCAAAPRRVSCAASSRRRRGEIDADGPRPSAGVARRRRRALAEAAAEIDEARHPSGMRLSTSVRSARAAGPPTPRRRARRRLAIDDSRRARRHPGRPDAGGCRNRGSSPARRSRIEAQHALGQRPVERRRELRATCLHRPRPVRAVPNTSSAAGGVRASAK